MPDPSPRFGSLTVLELSERVREAREARGLSRADLDALLEEDGCDRQTATLLEAGAVPLMRRPLDSLTRHLRRPDTWFTGGASNER